MGSGTGWRRTLESDRARVFEGGAAHRLPQDACCLSLCPPHPSLSPSTVTPTPSVNPGKMPVLPNPSTGLRSLPHPPSASLKRGDGRGCLSGFLLTNRVGRRVCGVCVGCLFLRTPSRAPYRTPSACANRAAYPDPPRSPRSRIHRRPGVLPLTAQH